MNCKVEEILNYIKKYYEYHGGTWEIINENDEEYIHTIFDLVKK